jgi:hypothetical protein
MFANKVPRRAMAGLIVVGLGLGIWMLWPRGDQASPVTTTPSAVETTSTTRQPEPTTTSMAMTTTTVEETHVVETVEEAEAILRELWFGWFEGIYNQDEDRIREVVATEEQVEAALEQFGAMEFLSEPNPSAFSFTETEILRADEQCLAVWSEVNARKLIGASNDGVHIFRWYSAGWTFVSQWDQQEDLWEADCDAQL